jgi:hypothetical protein
VDVQRSRWGWYGELPPPVLAAAVVRAIFLAFLPVGVWLYSRHFKDARSRTERLPTRTVVGALVVFGVMNILRQPRWAKRPQPVDPNEESAPADAGP